MGEPGDPSAAELEELDLIEEDPESLEPDTSDESVAEAGMSDTGPESMPEAVPPDVPLEEEEEEEGIAR